LAELNNLAEDLESELTENVELAELAEMDDDAELLDAAADALAETKKAADAAELLALMSGEADGNDCFVEIHPGAGGTEAQDWAEMVLRMYMRWANSRGMRLDENGIRCPSPRPYIAI